MSLIIVLAKVTPKPGCSDSIVEISKVLIENTLAEEGNIDYQLLKSTDDDTLTFVEKWESAEALQKHMASPHFQRFGEDSEEFAENMDIQVLSATELNYLDLKRSRIPKIFNSPIYWCSLGYLP